MLSRFFFPALVTISLLSGCVSTSVEPVRPEDCKVQVERWAANAQGIQGVPQGDGGIIFVKPGIDHLDLFVIASELHAPKVANEVKQGQEQKTIGPIKEGLCTSPTNGYPYRTFQFRLTPAKQRASL